MTKIEIDEYKVEIDDDYVYLFDGENTIRMLIPSDIWQKICEISLNNITQLKQEDKRDDHI